MPPKKNLIKPKPKSKAKAQEPQTENDFLDAADEYEQAMGKWRAGDVAKATRFLNRAIDTYNEGLKRYPRSFDLAYNKANLEYNITEDDRIVSQLGSKQALLEETLKSHRFAASLNDENTDILFNTGQVLTSLAEAQLESGTMEAGRYEASLMLSEAISNFNRCLAKQESEYAQMQAAIAQAEASGEYREAWEGERTQQEQAGDQDEDAASSSSEAAGDWATVEEPVTPETILETCTAQLGAISTFIGLYDPQYELASVEKSTQDGLETVNNRIPALFNLIDKAPVTKAAPAPQAGPTLSIGGSSADEEDETTPKQDALLAIANFKASVAEVTFRATRSSPLEYAQSVDAAFSSLITESEKSGQNLVTANNQSGYADALIDLASTLADVVQAPDDTHLDIQWTALSQAQTILTTLTSASYNTILSPARLADVFLARGDTDLFRFRLSLLPTAKPAWSKSGAVLLGNAGVFYRGARSYAERAGAAQVHGTADAKAVVAEILKDVAGGNAGKKEEWRVRGKGVPRVLEQMVEEGIVGAENVQGVLDMVQ